MRTRWCSGAACVAVLALGCLPFRLPRLSPRVAELPGHLSETGLYAGARATELAGDVRPYEPAYELWSDGATKRRWIHLPAGNRIDTADMDNWVFPVGTKLWKEFSVGGRRIETRLLARLNAGPDGWVALAYAWNAEGTDAVARPDGVDDALETSHDVPEARACMTCHGGRSHRVLGFSALQLARPKATPRDLTLDGLVAEGLVSAPPRAPLAVPGTPAEAAALGYLHANCGSCHNSARPPGAVSYAPPPELDLWLRADALSNPSATPTYQTIGKFVVPGAPLESPLYRWAAGVSWFLPRMPPIATKVIDRAGLATLERWIVELGGAGRAANGSHESKDERNMQRVVTIYASVALAVAIALVVLAARIGRRRAASWLVMLGIFILWAEEPALTLWFGLASPAADHDGMATLVTPQARAHVLDAAAYGTLLMAFLAWTALAPFRRGERWAGRALLIALVVFAATLLSTTAFVHGRGLPMPFASAATRVPGFGWQPLAVALLAWGAGLVVRRADLASLAGPRGQSTV
jgi:hypothetical protein